MAMEEVVVVAAQLEKFARPRRHLEQGRANRAYMTAAVTRRVRMVEAIDVSRGVLAVLNGSKAPQTSSMRPPKRPSQQTQQGDLACSFAVVQHLTDETLRRVPCVLRLRLRPGGTLLLHFCPTGGSTAD